MRATVHKPVSLVSVSLCLCLCLCVPESAFGVGPPRRSPANDVAIFRARCRRRRCRQSDAAAAAGRDECVWACVGEGGGGFKLPAPGSRTPESLNDHKKKQLNTRSQKLHSRPIF